MDTPKVGDKLFIYGKLIQFFDHDTVEDAEYNSLSGFKTVGGYECNLEPSEYKTDAVPGFLIEFPHDFWIESQFRRAKRHFLDESGESEGYFTSSGDILDYSDISGQKNAADSGSTLFGIPVTLTDVTGNLSFQRPRLDGEKAWAFLPDL